MSELYFNARIRRGRLYFQYLRYMCNIGALDIHKHTFTKYTPTREILRWGEEWTDATVVKQETPTYRAVLPTTYLESLLLFGDLAMIARLRHYASERDDW